MYSDRTFDSDESGLDYASRRARADQLIRTTAGLFNVVCPSGYLDTAASRPLPMHPHPPLSPPLSTNLHASSSDKGQPSPAAASCHATGFHQRTSRQLASGYAPVVCPRCPPDRGVNYRRKLWGTKVGFSAVVASFVARTKLLSVEPG